ncbi:MAG: hypothetical protein QM705_09270 [Ancrocorticia sp.]
MKNYRPSFGTIFIGLFAVLLGTGALLSAFGFNVFFSPRLNLTWLVAGVLVLCAVLLLTAALWPQRKKDADAVATGTGSAASSAATGSLSASSAFSTATPASSAPATESFATSQTEQFSTQPTQRFATQPTQEFNSAGFDAPAKEEK